MPKSVYTVKDIDCIFDFVKIGQLKPKTRIIKYNKFQIEFDYNQDLKYWTYYIKDLRDNRYYYNEKHINYLVGLKEARSIIDKVFVPTL